MKSSSGIKIAIDGNEANVSNRVGSNTYAFEILKALESLTRDDSDISITVLLSQPPLSDLPSVRRGWLYQVVWPRPLWTQLALPIHLYFHSYDVFYTPGHYAPRLSPIPYVSSVMDLAFLVYPEQFQSRDLIQLTNWTAYSVKKAAKVIAISQATKQDVIKRYQRVAEDIVVAYPATENRALPTNKGETQAVLAKFKIQPPYFLYVGTFQPRKNLERLVAAFEKVVEDSRDVRGRYSDVQLVLAGKVGWLADDILERIKTSPYADRIITPGYITEDEKVMLYYSAQATALVGLYEGFGMPALEAMQLGTLPVVSQTMSLPEVVGKAGILVDPEDVESIANGLTSALRMSAKERARYRKEARTQVKKFNWLESAQVVLATLREVAHRGR